MATETTVKRMRRALDACILAGYHIRPWGCAPLDEDEVAKVRQMRTHADLQGKAALSELIAANDEVLAEIGRGE